DLELLDGVDHREVRHLPRLRLQDGDAVVEILVRARPPAVDARQHGIGRQGDARDDGGEHDEQPAVERQLDDLLVFDDGPQARGLSPQDRGVTDHRHLFSNVSNAQFEIDPRFFTSLQTNALATDRLEARQLDREGVFAGREARRGVDAIVSGDDHVLKIRPYLGNGDGRTGNSRPGLIFHDAGDLAGRRLGTSWQYTDKPRARHRKADRTQSTSSHTVRCPRSRWSV